jgi:hypothetical protein
MNLEGPNKCPYFSDGKIDAELEIGLKDESLFENRSDYISYSRGYATHRAILDSLYERSPANTIRWPIEASNEYLTLYLNNRGHI